MVRFRTTLLALVLGFSLVGCSLFVPKLQKPTLSIVNVRIHKSDLWHQELTVRVRVQNPNDRALPVKRLSYQVEVDGQELAHGMSVDSFVVPARGEAEFDMGVSANMAGVLMRLVSQGNNSVDYHLSGKISLSAGLWRTIPFNDHGTFKWQ